MPKTVIEKTQSPSSEVTVFKIRGTLGFHEKETLEKLFGECKKRNLNRIVFDVAELTSLGGGCAQILRDEAMAGVVVFGVAGAKKTVLKFLSEKDSAGIVVTDTVDEAIAGVLSGSPAVSTRPQPLETESDDELVSEESLNSVLAGSGADVPETEPEPETKPQAMAKPDVAPAKEPPARPRTEQDYSRRAEGGLRRPAPPSPPVAADPGGDLKELQKRIVQYNTLFTINSEFYRIQDRKSLLDIFLLTTIAQVGVESAIFMEYNRGYFVPIAAKGVELRELRGLAIAESHLNLNDWKKSGDIHKVEKAPFSDDAKAPLLSIGCEYAAPFIVYGLFRGIVLLGQPIKNELDSSTIEFLRILVNQAAIAYESMARFEEENERTLGLVQTLISLIEENTLARGSTNLISNYVFALAQKAHYPEEHIRDLMYGTVLRDIGMIKVSDLIVRSPRELLPEEWGIIKRHPIEGADMLRRMKFSDHATGIVVAHHERFNGEGYPNGLQGQDIPMGARIVSVVESHAAMLQERPTRPALTREEALHTLKENWGMRYDPEVVRQFAEIIEQEIRSGEQLGDRKFELFSV